MTCLKVLRAGPYVSVQDAGRFGYLRIGVSPSGAVDLRALEEGRLLVGNQAGLGALEMLKLGGRFEVHGGGVRAALTGASLPARLDEKKLELNCSFSFEPGQVLEIGAAQNGNYGYLSLSGGIDTACVLGSRSTHVRAGFGGFRGRCLRQGDELSIGPSDQRSGDFSLPLQGTGPSKDVRILWGPQGDLFGPHELERFAKTQFQVSHELDRMGARLTSEALPVRSKKGLVAISGAIALGDIQIPGNGRPIVLLADRQPTGGYPRIATIIGADIAEFAQRPAGARVRFKPVSEQAAVAALRAMADGIGHWPDRLKRRSGDPLQSHKLLSQNLISGVVSSSKDPQE